MTILQMWWGGLVGWAVPVMGMVRDGNSGMACSMMDEKVESRNRGMEW